MTVAIQGFEGSFHQIAAQGYFKRDLEILPCATFQDLIRGVLRKEASLGVMAIENSIAGSILPNYSLLQKSDLQVMGEIYLNIRQNLMVLPGQGLEDIREVHSHPMALLQCMDYLNEHPGWKLVETEDTALSARHIRQRHATHMAAIAGKLAADLFQLEILAPDIHTMKKNYTRFLVVCRQEDLVREQEPNKSSVYFHTDHTRGSLARVLVRIADGGINLSKLQSFPIPGSEWKYYFHADMEFDSQEQFQEVIREIRPLTEGLKILGLYKKGLTL